MEKTTLIITEKPAAAEKIASALSKATDEKLVSREGVSYFEFHKEGRRYLVGCAVGHLFGIQQKALRGPFPNFEVSWQPAHQKKSGSFTKKYLATLKRLAKESDEFIVATDFDVEGEVIGWNVIRFVCKKKTAKRMKFSSLTTESLNKSFENMMSDLNWGAAIAGETRHYIDWFYGINLSRGLMKALSKTGTFRILSIGRVQGPALNILATREKEIEDFKSEPYWNIFLRVQDIKKQTLEVKHPKDIFNKSELLKFKHLQGKSGTSNTKLTEEKIEAPKPYDLTTLQTEAYKNHGYTPSQSLKIAQELYLAGLISYPRTSSQKYPVDIGYDKILKKLKRYTTLVKYAVNKKPTEGKKTDPAHPAIYPTGDLKKVPERNKRVYDLIVKRFISCFCKEARTTNKRVSVDVNGLKFGAKGVKIEEKGWMNVYPGNVKENSIPTLNGSVDVLEIRVEEKETKPPRRYSAASLVKELEKRGLGTKATRAGIIETLYSRGYVINKSIEVTELGMRMRDTLSKYSPVILDEEMTRTMTEKLEKIEVAKSGFLKMEEKILEDSRKIVSEIAKSMTENIDEMGKSLSEANAIVIKQEKESNTMTKCPKCSDGNLRISYGKRFSRFFVSCDNYPNCKNTYSLPPRGLMKPARLSKKSALEREGEEGDLHLCEECSYPMIQSFQKGRAPWTFCFNPECIKNVEVEKKKAEFKAKLASGEIEIVDGKVVDHGKVKKKVKKKKVKKKSKK
ncbi:MAG: DNA topoisomerase I [Nanoarchaeota archaeon]|nr:DNA topoisomerase I [Nanoarchaeota archaeon]